MLIPSLGTTSRIWDATANELERANPGIRVIRHDLPGHGRGPTATEPFSIADIAATVIARVSASSPDGPVMVAGVSMGGAVALEVARSRPEWLTSFAMFSSAASFGTPAAWRALIDRVTDSGTVSLSADSAAGWFTPGFRLRDSGDVVRYLDDLAETDDRSYVLCCEALAAYDASDALQEVCVPALVVAGSDDSGPTPATMRALADSLPCSRYEELAPAAHLGVVEHPRRAAGLLLERFAASSDSGC